MTPSYHKRKLELMLLLGVFFVVLCGMALVFFGKQVNKQPPPQALNVNTASAAQIAQALGTPTSTGQKIVARREKRPGQRFTSLFDMEHDKALHTLDFSALGKDVCVRSQAEVTRGFWTGVLLFLAAFLAAHLALRRFAPGADGILLPIVALLSGLGLICVYTVKDPYRDTFVFTGQVWGIAVYGLISLLVPLLPPFGRLMLRRYQYLYAVAAIGLMVLLIAAGHGPGGIHIRVFGFEPVEIIKVLMVFFVAAYLADRQGLLATQLSATPRWRDFAPLAAIYAFAMLLFVIVKDLGPAVLLFGAFLGLLWISTQRALYSWVGVALLLLAGWVGYAAHLGFFRTRMTMWLNPWANTDKNGAQLAMGLWGMATGGLFGSGLGLGDPARTPRAGSDFIFATIGEELGLVGALCVLMLFVFLMMRGFRIALRAATEFDRLLAAGLTLLLTLQATIIAGGVTGLFPLTGITLPFISYGTSSLVADFFVIGMLLHLSAKTMPEAARDLVTPQCARTIRMIAFGCASVLLLGVGCARLAVVQGLLDTQTATRLLRTPDADGVSRPHINPRLLAYAAGIPRGEILDRNGTVLARDAANATENATDLLTSDGRLRVYTGGAAFGHLLADLESPQSDRNPLGRNDRLRGFVSYADLLPLYRTRNLPLAPHPQGENVTLTIDSRLQQEADTALHAVASGILDRRTGKPKNKGAAVVIDVAKGEVLASASIPSFDPATLTSREWRKLKAGEDKQFTLLDRAVQGLYPPGSAFKIVTATAALQNGLGSQIFDCRHLETNVRWRFNNQPYSRRRITDEEGFVPHGPTDLAKALRVSCNIYFAHMGLALGPTALSVTSTGQYGLKHMPSVAKIGEDLPDCAYGQGADLVTPLEMAHVAQAVANNGVLLPATYEKTSHSSPGTKILPPDQAMLLQQMLAGVTTDGTARGVFDGLPFSVAGKTGSAQNNQGDGTTHSWFVGFAPASHPTLAFSCVIENGGAGRGAAAPVCREILRTAF